MSALTGQAAELIRELDTRQVAMADGSRTMAEWVAARGDVTPDHARNLVNGARLLADQPGIARELDAGRMSFDRALVTAQLAAAGASEATLEAARGFDLGGVARLAAAHRRMAPTDHRA